MSSISGDLSVRPGDALSGGGRHDNARGGSRVIVQEAGCVLIAPAVRDHLTDQAFGSAVKTGDQWTSAVVDILSPVYVRIRPQDNAPKAFARGDLRNSRSFVPEPERVRVFKWTAVP